MKTKSTVIITISVLALVITVFAADRQKSDAPAASRKAPERFRTEVLRVIAANESDAVFRAYLVKWKGQEVVASDPLAMSHHQVGDTISVLATNHPYPNGKEGPRLLHFTVTTTP